MDEKPLVTDITDYCGNIIYSNDKIGMILTPEGYITKEENGSYDYKYYLKDHLGNNRVVINSQNAVVETTDYYPFGMPFAKANFTASVQPYKYGGKELEKMHGINWYDFGARMYDGFQWRTLDPLAEKKSWLSPYVYCSNNPIGRIDLDGRDDYRLNQNGEIGFVKKTNADTHTIYALNNKGNIDNKNSYEVGKYVLNIKETIDVTLQYSDKTTENVPLDIYTSIGDKNSTGLFEFLSKNSNVEWSQVKTTNGEMDVNYLITSRIKGADGGIDFMSSRLSSQNSQNSMANFLSGSSSIIIREGNHSHPNGSTTVSEGDVKVANNLYSRFPNAQMNIFTPNDRAYTPFNRFSQPGLLPEFQIIFKVPKKR